MKVLIIGGGGREHAMAWKAAQSARVDQVYVAPGNAGTELEPGIENVAIGADDILVLCQFAQREAIDLTIVGPEVPLVAGIVDTFQDAGLRCFGPSRQAARLEGSKVFCKCFLERHSIPTAAFASFTDEARARSFIREKGVPIVIKADGLAAGKGVVIAHTERLALDAVRDMLSGNVFGNAGHRVVIEEFLEGEEVSFIVMTDGEHILPMATSQDHKARDDGDQGPNTGGMGAYSPAPAVTSAVYRRIMTEVIEPTLAGLAADRMPYTGFLYAGLMITANGTPKVLEYNCRLGDPEAQPILMRLNSDLIDLCQAALDRKLDAVQAEWDHRAALGVVLTAGGYPGSYEKGDVIFGLPERSSDEEKAFHAGTYLKDGQIVTDGGRVLSVCALGESLAEAQARAYRLARTITWSNIYYRADIGHRAVGARDNQSK